MPQFQSQSQKQGHLLGLVYMAAEPARTFRTNVLPEAAELEYGP